MGVTLLGYSLKTVHDPAAIVRKQQDLHLDLLRAKDGPRSEGDPLMTLTVMDVRKLGLVAAMFMLSFVFAALLATTRASADLSKGTGSPCAVPADLANPALHTQESPLPLRANVRFVSAAGNDDNDCSRPARACRTVQRRWTSLRLETPSR